jgi:hypothetical protein
MSTRATSFCSAACLVAIYLALGPGCEKKADGEACRSDGECASGLVCDKHGRQTGVCHKPHGHTLPPLPDASADGPPEPDAGSPADTLVVAEAGPPIGRDGAVSSSAPDTGQTGGGVPDTAPPPPDAAPPGPDASLATLACQAYCTCMERNCRMLAYPWPSRAACLTACRGFSDSARSCFSRFCMAVPMAEAAEREHTCEHGAGELGEGECPYEARPIFPARNPALPPSGKRNPGWVAPVTYLAETPPIRCN